MPYITISTALLGPKVAIRVPLTCVCVLKTFQLALPVCSLLARVAQIMVFFRSLSNYTDRTIIRLHYRHLFGTLQLCFGWRVGLAPYSTKVEHVHEKRYRGKRL